MALIYIYVFVICVHKATMIHNGKQKQKKSSAHRLQNNNINTGSRIGVYYNMIYAK